MSVLIFGASGSIGSALAHSLHQAGRSAFLIARNTEKLRALDHLGFQHAACDVMEEGSIAAAVEAATAAGPVAGLAYCIGDITLKPLRRYFALSSVLR